MWGPGHYPALASMKEREVDADGEKGENVSSSGKHTCAPGDSCALQPTVAPPPSGGELSLAHGPGQPTVVCPHLALRILILDMPFLSSAVPETLHRDIFQVSLVLVVQEVWRP